MNAETSPDLLSLPWRQGRHMPRHMYAQLATVASDDDPYVGTLETPEAAAEACEAHNYRLRMRQHPVAVHGAT